MGRGKGVTQGEYDRIKSAQSKSKGQLNASVLAAAIGRDVSTVSRIFNSAAYEDYKSPRHEMTQQRLVNLTPLPLADLTRRLMSVEAQLKGILSSRKVVK